MGLRDAAEASSQRDAEREIQIRGISWVACLNLQVVGAERFEGLGIRPEEAPREAVFALVEITVPVCCELIIPVPAGVGDLQLAVIHARTTRAGRGVIGLRDSWSARNRRNQVSSSAATLVARSIQQRQRNRIDPKEGNGRTVGCRGTAENIFKVCRGAIRG